MMPHLGSGAESRVGIKSCKMSDKQAGWWSGEVVKEKVM